jgi:alpha-tubulin suppressor-like RCC1 family protein
MCLLFAGGCSDDGGQPGGGEDVGMDAGGDVAELDSGGDVGGDVENDVDPSSEVCDDGIDNDDDMDVDCRDEDCDGAAVCSFTQLDAGWVHACGVLESGHVVCWGSNAGGRIGNGESASEPVAPTVVEGLDGMVDVAVSLVHSCALSSDGTVHCWGNNEDGQLGDNSLVNSPFPVQVAELTDATAISAGTYHTCAITGEETGRRAYCWGGNFNNQAGVAVGEETKVPVRVTASSGTPLAGYTAISSGAVHTCAMKPSGGQGGHTVVCWGSNFGGQLGNGDMQSEHSVPMGSVRQKSDMAEIKDFVSGSLAAGENSTCAIRMDGSVWCWGDGSRGHFGSEALAEVQYAAVKYPGVGDARRLWHGLYHVCAERASGRVVCWGDNDGLAFHDVLKVHYNPVLLHDLAEPNDVAPGGRLTCWADGDGGAYCQGASDSGQLGTPSITQATSEPQRVYPEWQ